MIGSRDETARPHRYRAYVLAVVLTISASISALLLRGAPAEWVGNRPVLILVILPVIVSAYVGGLWPGAC
jgi:hypothetical protein